MKKFVSVILLLVFVFALSSTAFATTSVMDLSDAKNLVAQLPVEQTEELTYRKVVAATQMLQMQQMLNQQRGDALTAAKELLLSLGFSEKELLTIKNEDIISIFMDNRELTLEEQYVKTMPDGTLVVLDKNVCLLEAAAAEEAYVASLQDASTRSGSGDREETIGYMKIRTLSTYNNSSEKGWYQFYGWFTWLNTPLQRNTDAISLMATGFAWSQNSSDFYSVMNYDERVFTTSGGITTQNRTITKNTQDKTVQPEGLYYEWALPKDYSTITTNITYSNFLFSITGKARVSNYSIPTAFNLNTKYAHVNSHTKPIFSWSIGSLPGVSFGKNTSGDEYYSYNYTNYTP